MTTPKYTVYNKYGINYESKHRKVGCALRKRDAQEGDGWQVKDSEGNIWDWDWDRHIYISEYSSEN